MFIYKITNKINHKFYIGKTIGDINKRFNRHCRLSSKCLKLSAAIRKYGREYFSIECIDTAEDMEQLNQKEIFWIKHLRAVELGYNLTYGGEGGIPTKETVEKISKSKRGKKLSDSTRKKFSEIRTGHLNHKAKKVRVIVDGDAFVFDCLKYAASFLGMNYSTARSIAQKRNKKSRANIEISYLGDVNGV